MKTLIRVTLSNIYILKKRQSWSHAALSYSPCSTEAILHDGPQTSHLAEIIPHCTEGSSCQ